MKSFKFLFIFLFAFQFTMAQNALPKKMKTQFVGTWSLVAIENTNADGSKTFPYGEKPEGLLFFTENGEYAIQILKAERPKVKANDKSRATPEENVALVKGGNSHFGTYSVDATNHTIKFNVEHAFYPNWEGVEQIRSYTLKNGLLSYIVTNTTNGGAITAKVVWKKK
ncbi:lipocalin-like domain-containing protein [Muricauda sp. 334s03]|uniref:Lipocalin-like domain-containing protein n=1 Tax=Flagellimonas yonaguniensis TaxID=3031325 RepID=A0ABT5XYP1_9FLAO|nr:lipocalin-like domain-containing protein [[Muricauda] yonaguniensis]MDF0716304.1 lipocalin-like domain-containing protein [[Muricauda] yonaguniensis]